MKLSENRRQHRIESLQTSLARILADIEPEDQYAIVTAAVKPYLEIGEPETASLDVESLSALVETAMRQGLTQNNPQMVRAAREWLAEEAGRQFLNTLTVNIVPYEIQDKSIPRIVLECDDDVIREIEAALKQRREGSPAPASYARL